MLTREAWNALLKILEEPPPGVVFVFATTEPQKIAASAAPVMSRLQRFDFRRIGPQAIRDRLRQVLSAEGLSADDDALTLIARHADGGMRDALSVMDQCLSFGDGAVSAQRVREVLGLADDELYEEMLRLIVEHDPAAVFPLVDRLSDAGIDLTEFISGAAEVLRGVLMLQVGAEPEELTEAVRGTLERYRERLEPGDVLRMLQMLHDNEVNIRRNVNSRLTVETLLLRWAMLDRVVDLEQVLAQAGKRGSGEAGKARTDIKAAPQAPQPAGQRPPVEASPPPSVPASPPTAKLAPSIEAIRAGWPAIVVAARVQSRFLGELLASVEPSELALPWLNVVMREPNQLFAERLEQEATKVEEILSRTLGQPVRLRVNLVASPGGPPPAKRRLSDASVKADRLREFRSKDPALDTAADALDLEIVD
jgi:DNA polymerase III subunit gamma/tau